MDAAGLLEREETILEGTVEELLPCLGQWNPSERIRITKIESQEKDAITLLNEWGAVWKNGVPILPAKEGHVPATLEEIKMWLNDED
jgi:hypothetical protein